MKCVFTQWRAAVFCALFLTFGFFSTAYVFAQAGGGLGSSFVLLPPCSCPSGQNPPCLPSYTVNAFAYAVINIIQFMLSIAGSVALLFFVWGGVRWVTSGGAPDRVQAGVDIMREALIGLFIMFCAWILVNYAVAFLLGEGGNFKVDKLFTNSSTPWHEYKNICR